MYNLYEAIRKISILFYPFIPTTSENIFNQLGVTNEQKNYDSLRYLPDLENNKVIEKGIPLFERLDANIEIDRLKELMKVNS